MEEKKLEIGRWAIDTQRNEVVTICNILEDGYIDLYIVQTDEGEYYITDDNRLIPYDKYYFDRK